MLALVVLLQAAIGFGVVRRFQGLRSIQVLALSMLAGLPLSSILVIALDRVGIGINAPAMLIAFVLAAVALNLGSLSRTRAALAGPWPRPRALRADEVIFAILVVFFLAVSLWQCVRLPVIPRDATVGADLVAKVAIREGRIDSSIFTGETLRGQLSNQPYYAPFAMLMQIVFRLAGMPFGQVWLSVLFISFVIYMWSRLRETTHPLLAGFLMLALATVPLMYSYSYLVNTDFANAIFFGLGVLLLHDARRRRKTGLLALGGLFMGFACWSRTETILFVLLGTPLVLFGATAPVGAPASAREGRRDGRSRLQDAACFLTAPVALFLLWHLIYMRFVFPDAPRMTSLAAGVEGRSLTSTIGGVLGLLAAHDLYGTIIDIFGLVLVANLIIFRDRRGLDLLGWIGVLLVGFILVVQIFPAAFVESTVKRGYFKLFPIMIAYLAETRLLAFLSEKLTRFERPAVPTALS